MTYTLQDHIKKKMNDPDFSHEYETLSDEFEIVRNDICREIIINFIVANPVSYEEFIAIFPKILNFCKTTTVPLMKYLSALSLLLCDGASLDNAVELLKSRFNIVT